MVNIVPFFPEQLRLPEQPVHLFLVPARPEGQRAAQGQIGLGLTAEFLLPTAFPQCGKVLAVLSRGGLFQHLLVRQGNRANGPFCFVFRRLFLGDVGFMNPGQRLRTIRNVFGRTVQPVAGHGEIPRRRIHLHRGLTVLIALGRHEAAIENVQSRARGRNFSVRRILCQNAFRRLIEFAVLIAAMVNVHAYNAARLGKYKAHAGKQVLLPRGLGLRQRRPRLRIGGGSLPARFRIIGHLPRLLAFRIGLQPPADPLRQRRQFFRKIHAMPLLPLALFAFCLARCTERGGRLELGRSLCFFSYCLRPQGGALLPINIRQRFTGGGIGITLCVSVCHLFHLLHVPEIRAVGRLGHNGHVHFREGLRIHARLNEGDGLGQLFLRQFKHQFVVNL